ncbi:recombination protein NinB (plasmid) [Burkholderia ambifaria]
MTVYVLRSPEIASRMIAEIKALAGPAASSGRPIVVEVTEYDSIGSNEQLRFLFGVVLSQIAEQVELDGRRFDRDAWYGHYLNKFAPKKDTPSGLIPMGVSQMKKRERADFTTKIQADAAQEYGVEFAAI